jgi:hypothetical protein
MTMPARGKDRQLATVSRLRPRTGEASAHRRPTVAQISESNVIDLAQERARRRAPGAVYSPPEGTAA